MSHSRVLAKDKIEKVDEHANIIGGRKACAFDLQFKSRRDFALVCNEPQAVLGLIGTQPHETDRPSSG
jgi:hypothetical protein